MMTIRAGLKNVLLFSGSVSLLVIISVNLLQAQSNDTILSGNQILTKIQYGSINFTKVGYHGPELGTSYGWDISTQYIHSTGTKFLPGIGLGARYVNFNNDSRKYFIANRFMHARVRAFIHYQLMSGCRWQIMPGIAFIGEWSLWSDNKWRSKNPFEFPFYLYPKEFRPRHEVFAGLHMDAELTGMYRLGRGFVMSVTAAFSFFDMAKYRLKEYRGDSQYFNCEYRFSTGLSVNAGIAYVIKL